MVMIVIIFLATDQTRTPDRVFLDSYQNST